VAIGALVYVFFSRLTRDGRVGLLAAKIGPWGDENWLISARVARLWEQCDENKKDELSGSIWC
jgi:hypothetical protein